MTEDRAARMRNVTSADELRTLLSEEIDRLRSGEATPAEARAVTREAGKILATFQAGLRLGKQIRLLEQEADAGEKRIGPGRP